MLTVTFLCVLCFFSVSAAPTASPEVCLTPDCIIAAAGMLKKMNLSADPCVDFNQYACGRFLQETAIPDGAIDVVSFTIVEDANVLVMKEIMTEVISNKDPVYLQNMKRYYQSCVDEDQIENIYYTEYFKDPLSKDFPTISKTAWSDANFSLSHVVARYQYHNVERLFRIYVDSDERNSSRSALYIDQPELGIAPEYLKRPRNDTVIVAYEKYLTEIANELGAPIDVSETDVIDVVNLEIALSEIQVPQEDTRDTTQQYHPINLKDLANRYPELNISRALRAAFAIANESLSDDDIVIDRFPNYIGNVTEVTKRFSNRTIQNLLAFRYAIDRVGGLTKRMREIKQDFDRVYKGTTSELPRWRTCVNEVSDIFHNGMGKQFVERAFPQASKDYVDEMVANLRSTFHDMIENVTWMADITKAQAVQKLADIRQKIGYPVTGFSDPEIDDEFKNYKMDSSNYYENRVLKDRLKFIHAVQSLRKPINKDEFAMAPYIVNAQYSPNWNDITFPAGILQPPFFSHTFLDSVNYGGIGVVIGHEITHGFDDQGRRYDGDGNLKNWWTATDEALFVNKTQCIIDQNNGFLVKEINLHVNGINTQGEAAADNGGIKESFRAYKKLVSEKGEQPVLPGLDLSNEQLFFLSFGQIWCDKIKPESLRIRTLTNVHPPSEFRIIGPLQNSPDFAKAYNCPKESYMNPDKKCGVW